MCCLLLSCPLRRLSALPLPLLLKPVSVDSKIQDTKAQDDKTKDDSKTEENKPPDTDDSVDRLGPIAASRLYIILWANRLLSGLNLSKRGLGLCVEGRGGPLNTKNTWGNFGSFYYVWLRENLQHFHVR